MGFYTRLHPKYPVENRLLLMYICACFYSLQAFQKYHCIIKIRFYRVCLLEQEDKQKLYLHMSEGEIVMDENTVYEDKYFKVINPIPALHCRDDGGHLILIKKESP